MGTSQESMIPALLEQAILDTFRVQINQPTQVISKSVETPGKPVSHESIDCMSLLALSAKQYEGVLALGFPRQTFLAVLEAMLGEKHDRITAENADASGELLNIIYASSRVKINEAGFDFQPAIPNTVHGEAIALSATEGKSMLKILCRCESGPFIVALHLKKKS